MILQELLKHPNSMVQLLVARILEHVPPPRKIGGSGRGLSTDP